MAFSCSPLLSATATLDPRFALCARVGPWLRALFVADHACLHRSSTSGCPGRSSIDCSPASRRTTGPFRSASDLTCLRLGPLFVLTPTLQCSASRPTANAATVRASFPSPSYCRPHCFLRALAWGLLQPSALPLSPRFCTGPCSSAAPPPCHLLGPMDVSPLPAPGSAPTWR